MADQSTPATNPSPIKKRKKPGLILGTLAGVLLAGGGAAAYWFTRQPPDAAVEEHAPESNESGGIVTFEPFVVNLADNEGARFLRIGVQLVVAGKEEAAEVDEDEVVKVRLRSTLLELLAEQTSDRLVTAEGKTALKAAISMRASSIVAPHKVSDVLFTDFIVQF